MRNSGLPMALLDRYQTLFLIGRGGMGTVEAAVERGGSGGGRVIALKRMLPNVRDRRHVVMFLREARLATLLNHENVVHAFAFGEQDGELFIAMEHVEGETLGTLQASLCARSERLPIPLAAYVLVCLCEGLHAAHELRDVGGKPLGLVHRDVSPHNVMLSYAGDVKLLDFGVAKLENAAQLTKTGEVKGKTAYMSPEQAMGDALDRRSDLYGVGAILFELLAGRRMWTGETDLELLRQLALAEPPSLADVVPDAPEELVALHARLVSKDPAARPATARDVADVLRPFVQNDREEPAAALARLLDAHYAEHKRVKAQKLADALARRDDPSDQPGAVTSPASRARAAPWMYALVGAAVASAAVIGVARTRPAETQVTSSPTTTATASASTSAPVQTSPVTPQPSAAPLRPLRVIRASPLRPQATTHAPPSATTTTAPPPPTAKPPLDVDPHAI